MSSNLDSLSPEKRALMQKLLAQKGQRAASGIETIPARGDASPAPLSFLQEGMWFIDNLNPGQANYNVPMAARLAGELDIPALERALAEIRRRHESLRTTFNHVDGRLRQVIAPAGPYDLPFKDISTLPADRREREALRLAAEEARRPFDLAAGPLFRAQLVRLGSGDHLLLVTIHHIITDGWSMGVLTRELTALYGAFAAGEPSPLPNLPVQFGDYAHWQRQRLQGERLENLHAFWKEQLAGHGFVLDLPVDFPRPPLQTGAGRHLPFDLPADGAAALRRWSRQDNVTLFAVMLAVFKVLLGAAAGQDDVIVGTPIANRDKSELEGLIGYFVNLLPLRTRLPGDESLRDLARRINRDTQAANQHQELPFGKLVEALQPQRDPSRNPIFQVEFTLLDPAHAPPVYGYGFRSPVEQTLSFAGLTLRPLDVESEASKFDLTVLLWDMGDGVSGTFEYDSDLFQPETVQALVGNFRALLLEVGANPDMRIEALKERYAALAAEDQARRRQERRAASAKKIKNIRRKRGPR